MKKEQSISVIEPSVLAQRIFIIRGHKVMFDFHLAELYLVPVKRLNEQVKRNTARFPIDFMFQLTKAEFENLISQIAISSSDNGNWSQIATSSQKHRRQDSMPYAFTEHGVAMLSSVLRSDRAIQMNAFIIRAFVKIRELLATNKDLAHKLDELERRQSEQDNNLAEIYSIVKQLIDEPIKQVGPMGFATGKE